MPNWSLKWRSFFAAFLVLMVFIPLTALTLEKAFVHSLSESMREQLEIERLGLMSEFDLIGGDIVMPENLFNDSLNIPASGSFAFISMHKLIVWQSGSTVNWPRLPDFEQPPMGQPIFTSQKYQDVTYFLHSFTGGYEDGQHNFLITFHILKKGDAFDNEIKAFRRTLWRGLILISLGLIALLSLSLLMALKPISSLARQIRQIREGQRHKAEGQFPPELEQLKDGLNHLLDSEQNQRQRYHNTLGDLAHSLKTPLAVLKSNDKVYKHAAEPLEQIENIINRQLKRAVASSSNNWQQAEVLEPIVLKLVNAMNKVYADKNLDIRLYTDGKPAVNADKTDILELFGNIVDNACKAAKGVVEIDIQTLPNSVQVIVEDDGPGIDEAKKQHLLQRGKRLDTYDESSNHGQGIGMSVVTDLLAAYQGSLDIRDSELGGAKFVLRFKKPEVQ